MQVLDATQGQQRSGHLQSILDLADLVAETSLDMRVPEQSEQSPVQKTQQQQTERERMVQSLAKDCRGKSRAEILHDLGPGLGVEVADAVQRQAPTAQQAYALCEREVRAAHAKRGKALQALPNPPMHHSVKDYTHVIVTQLDLLQDGPIPSVSAVVNAAFPDDPKKATSIQNSQHGKRRKQAWASPAVVNHPMEIAMQHTHGRHDMNRRLTARTFGQSLSINAVLFKSSDRDNKQDAETAQLKREVALLKQQMRETKARESLADAGCSTPREMVLALRDQGKGATAIARELGMNENTVKSIIRRSKAG